MTQRVRKRREGDGKAVCIKYKVSVALNRTKLKLYGCISSSRTV